MSTGTDLTRWNRAGLSRFRYVDGNAVTFLELLRAELASRFPGWQEVKALPSTETEGERQERMLEQYHAPRRDWAWEIARVLARASHVLTEHLDVYANEGFLGTATQWDSVRRLVEMIDYHPAPPASASSRSRRFRNTSARSVSPRSSSASARCAIASWSLGSR